MIKEQILVGDHQGDQFAVYQRAGLFEDNWRCVERTPLGAPSR